MKWLGNLGPGLLVTAAFIGPWTIITAGKAGADSLRLAQHLEVFKQNRQEIDGTP